MSNPEQTVKRKPGRPKKVQPVAIPEVKTEATKQPHVFTEYQKHEISKILAECSHSHDEAATIEYLIKNRTQPMVDVLRLIYDKSVKFTVDTKEIPGKTREGYGFVNVTRAIRSIGMIVTHPGQPKNNIAPQIQERIKATMFDEIVSDDYELLVHIFTKKPLPGISSKVAEAVIV